jgi:hypothetical protein
MCSSGSQFPPQGPPFQGNDSRSSTEVPNHALLAQWLPRAALVAPHGSAQGWRSGGSATDPPGKNIAGL